MSINCSCKILSYIALLALALYIAHATDPTQLQDFCVGTNDPNNACNLLSFSIYGSPIYIILFT